MKVVFDNIVFSLQKTGGISVVWYELLKRISNNKMLNSIYVEYNGYENIFRKMLVIDPQQIHLRNSFALSLKRYFDVSFPGKEKFLFHSSYYRICSNKKAINITTVHDFTYELYVSGLKKRIHCWQKHRAIRNSDYIVCISQNTKADLNKFVPGLDENRIRVVYNGVSEEYSPLFSDDFDISLTSFAPFSFVLFVGSREKYKNFELAAKAVAASNLNLVIIGNKLTDKEIVFLSSLMDKSRYCTKKNIPNSKLNNLYNQAFCLLYPSSYEGFGIPVLEAQKAGCPVIAYNSSSIPEIIGNTSLLLDELTVESITEKFTLLNDSDIRRNIIEEGIENAKRFSWDFMYEDMLNIYKEALSL